MRGRDRSVIRNASIFFLKGNSDLGKRKSNYTFVKHMSDQRVTPPLKVEEQGAEWVKHILTMQDV